jgi:flagellar export protein FliJ
MSPKPKYRLQALLTLRGRLKKKAEMALARAIKELNEAKERLKKLEKEKERIVEEYEQARKDMAQQMLGASSVGKGNVYVNFLRKLKEDEEAKEEEIEDQKQVVQEKEDGVAMARRDYIDAAKQLQVMEKHKELWEKKLRKELSMREQREMNELGNSIHQLRRWRGERSAMEAQ